MKTGFTVFIAFLVTLRMGAIAKCDGGCSLDPNESGGSVCGVDGITYFNACLTECQGIQVVGSGPCRSTPPSPGFELAPPPIDESFETAGTITRETMTRFANEGFSFVGRRRVDLFDDGPVGEQVVDEEAADERRRPATGMLGAVRITPQGDEYRAILKERNGSGEVRATAGLGPVVDETMRRALKIIGEDTRSDVPNPEAYPMSTIGHLVPIGCTGTVISRSAVLTAGHCVYDNVRGTWLVDSLFIPARHMDDFGYLQEPFGTWEPSSRTTYTQWIDGDSSYDIAIITYRPRRGCGFLGDFVGFVGFRQVTFDNPGVQAATTTITGYGQDIAPDMWTSGPCDGNPRHSNITEPFSSEHWCDTLPGNSGSSVFDTSAISALGVHTATFTAQDRGNIALLFTPDSPHFDSIFEWSERGETLPSCFDPCPCTKIWQVLCVLRYLCIQL